MPTIAPGPHQPPSLVNRTLARPGLNPATLLLAAHPDGIVVDHPDSETPSARQAGTLGESTSLVRTVKAQCEQSLFLFNLVMMGGHTLMQHRPQGEYCHFLQQVPPHRKGLLAPRGTLKTTITKGLVLHVFIQPLGGNIYFPHGRIGYLNHNEGRSTRVLLASKGSDLSQDKLIELRTYIERTPLLRAFWPACFWHDPSRQATAWNNEHIFLPRNETFKEASIETSGVGATITGSHFNVIVHDDLVDEKDRYSSTTMERAYSWFLSTRALFDDIEHALEFILGTHWNNNDIYVRIKRDGLGVEWKTYSAIMDNGAPLWPEVHSLQSLELIKRDLDSAGKGDLFALNYLNDPMHSSIVAFNAGLVRFFTMDEDAIYIADDLRDMDLCADYTNAPRRGPDLLRGQPLTPALYKQYRSDLAPDLRMMHYKPQWDADDRYRIQKSQEEASKAH